jgi:hypothetical protein
MIDITCPHCQAQNGANSSYCSACGALLERSPIILRREDGLTVAGYNLPARQLKQIGASLAVSAAALLAEAGLLWLRRRVQTMRAEPLPTPRPKAVAQPKKSIVIMPTPEDEAPKEVITVFSERVVEVHRWGRPIQRIVERMAWRREES